MLFSFSIFCNVNNLSYITFQRTFKPLKDSNDHMGRGSWGSLLPHSNDHI